jgi:hypothetical protein
MNRKIIYASIIVALTTQPMLVNAAERIDPGNRASTKAMLGATNIYKLTNSDSNELQMAHVQEIGDSRLVRFDQYHLGVPVFGASLVMETDGSAANGLVKRVGGSLLTGLDFDIPSKHTAIDLVGALDVARRHLKISGAGQPPKENESAHLYVWNDAAGKARLVYVVSIEVGKKTLVSRPTLIIDANTSTILDRWESRDKGDGTGPGGYLKPAAKALAARGWDSKKIDQLFSHAQNLYQTENSLMSTTNCGAVQAANDLGFSAKDVRTAFSTVGVCRSNSRKYTLYNGGQDKVAEITPITTRAVATSTLTTKYGTWRKFERNDFTLLPRWDTAGENLAKAKSSLGITSDRPRVDVVYINKMNISNGNGFQTTSQDYCSKSGACVDIRMNATGSRSQNDTFTSWSLIKGLTPQQFPATRQSVVTTLNAGSLWSTANTISSSWAYTVSSEVSVGASFGFKNAASVDINVTFGASATKSGETSKTFTNNFYNGGYKIPAGCYAIITPVERWKQRYDTWNVRPQVQGNLEAYTYPALNGQEYTKYAATSHFNDLTTIPTYKLTLNDRSELINSVTVVGKKFADGTACALTAL